MNLRVGEGEVCDVAGSFGVGPFSQADYDGIYAGRACCCRRLRDIEFFIEGGAGDVGDVVRADFLADGAENRRVSLRWVRGGFVALPGVAPAVV